MWPSMLWSVDSCQNSVSADQYRLTVSRAQFVNILYCMACSTSIQDGENSVFWLVTWAGLSCPIGISRFVPPRSRLLVTDNKTFIDQAWDQLGWILALFYLLTLCYRKSFAYTVAKVWNALPDEIKCERSIGAFKDRLDFPCLSKRS